MRKEFKHITLCGGGAQTHVIAAWLASEGYSVSILTRRPTDWGHEIVITTPDGERRGQLKAVSADAADVVPGADVVLLTVPGYANASILNEIAPYVGPECYVGGVFCSSGFFFEAMKILPESTPLWGFQRVPFICRVTDYGHRADLKGYRPLFHIAVERVSDADKEQFREWVEKAFGSPTKLLGNYLEASITNSNPILHTSRLYTMFADWPAGHTVPANIPFYEEWTVEAADLMIKMDAELFELLAKLPVSKGYLVPLMEYYEGHDAASVAAKLRSISGLKGILSPMRQTGEGWEPDYADRYFREDFGFSLRYIYELAHKYGVATPNIDKVYEWGVSVTRS